MSIERSRVEEECRQWLVRLDGDESLAEREAFDRWHADPSNAAAYKRAQRLWLAFDQLSGRPELERLSARALADTPAPGARVISRRFGWAVAASVAVCVLAGGAFYAGYSYTPTRTYATDVGQRSTIQLDDGSQVILNFDTTLEVKLGDTQRRFKLRKGEAMFTVAQDSRRPFTVDAGGGKVTALGTRFQVRNESRRVVVTLLEGRVAVDRETTGEHMQLQPGGQLNFAGASAPWRYRVVDPEVVSSWTAGRLKFKFTPLAEVLDEVNRYSKAKILLRDEALAKVPVNGIFEVGDSASVVSALELMLPLEARRQESGEIDLIRR